MRFSVRPFTLKCPETPKLEEVCDPGELLIRPNSAIVILSALTNRLSVNHVFVSTYSILFTRSSDFRFVRRRLTSGAVRLSAPAAKAAAEYN